MRPVETRQGYDLWAPSYDSTQNPMVAMADFAMDRTLPDVEGREVVELGCGTGRNFARFLGASSLVGLDFSEGMLAVARQRHPDVTLVHHDLRHRLPLADGCCDQAVFSLVLEHVEELGPALAEACRIVRAGGAVYLCEMHPFLALQGTGAHFRHQDGELRLPTWPHQCGDFVRAGVEAGLRVAAMHDWKPTPEVERIQPKVARHRGVPMLLTVLLLRP
ncbi:MAG: class I SAM-dependent methyltransferase [Candidatus Eremiobacterota bacterium]